MFLYCVRLQWLLSLSLIFSQPSEWWYLHRGSLTRRAFPLTDSIGLRYKPAVPQSYCSFQYESCHILDTTYPSAYCLFLFSLPHRCVFWMNRRNDSRNLFCTWQIDRIDMIMSVLSRPLYLAHLGTDKRRIPVVNRRCPTSISYQFSTTTFHGAFPPSYSIYSAADWVVATGQKRLERLSCNFGDCCFTN